MWSRRISEKDQIPVQFRFLAPFFLYHRVYEEVVAVASYTFSTDDRQEALLHLRAPDMACALWEIAYGKLRTYLKHGAPEELDPDTLEWCRKYVFEVLDEHGIDLDTLNQ